MIQRKYIFTAFPLLAVLGLLVSFFLEPDNELEVPVYQETESQILKRVASNETQEVQDAEEQVDSEAHDSHDHGGKVDTGNAALVELRAFPKEFNFKKETKRLAELQKNFPDSKRQLLNLILEQNKYGKAKAHSAAELAQRQQGALKVEALKTLFRREKDKAQLERDLLLVSERAKDPVLARMAESALDALAKGRPFFDDSVRALGALPIPD